MNYIIPTLAILGFLTGASSLIVSLSSKEEMPVKPRRLIELYPSNSFEQKDEKSTLDNNIFS